MSIGSFSNVISRKLTLPNTSGSSQQEASNPQCSCVQDEASLRVEGRRFSVCRAQLSWDVRPRLTNAADESIKTRGSKGPGSDSIRRTLPKVSVLLRLTRVHRSAPKLARQSRVCPNLCCRNLRPDKKAEVSGGNSAVGHPVWQDSRHHEKQFETRTLPQCRFS